MAKSIIRMYQQDLLTAEVRGSLSEQEYYYSIDENAIYRYSTKRGLYKLKGYDTYNPRRDTRVGPMFLSVPVEVRPSMIDEAHREYYERNYKLIDRESITEVLSPNSQGNYITTFDPVDGVVVLPDRNQVLSIANGNILPGLVGTDDIVVKYSRNLDPSQQYYLLLLEPNRYYSDTYHVLKSKYDELGWIVCDGISDTYAVPDLELPDDISVDMDKLLPIISYGQGLLHKVAGSIDLSSNSLQTEVVYPKGTIISLVSPTVYKSKYYYPEATPEYYLLARSTSVGHEYVTPYSGMNNKYDLSTTKKARLTATIKYDRTPPRYSVQVPCKVTKVTGVQVTKREYPPTPGGRVSRDIKLTLRANGHTEIEFTAWTTEEPLPVDIAYVYDMSYNTYKDFPSVLTSSSNSHYYKDESTGNYYRGNYSTRSYSKIILKGIVSDPVTHEVAESYLRQTTNYSNTINEEIAKLPRYQKVERSLTTSERNFDSIKSSIKTGTKRYKYLPPNTNKYEYLKYDVLNDTVRPDPFRYKLTVTYYEPDLSEYDESKASEYMYMLPDSVVIRSIDYCNYAGVYLPNNYVYVELSTSSDEDTTSVYTEYVRDGNYFVNPCDGRRTVYTEDIKHLQSTDCVEIYGYDTKYVDTTGGEVYKIADNSTSFSLRDQCYSPINPDVLGADNVPVVLEKFTKLNLSYCSRPEFLIDLSVQPDKLTSNYESDIYLYYVESTNSLYKYYKYKGLTHIAGTKINIDHPVVLDSYSPPSDDFEVLTNKPTPRTHEELNKFTEDLASSIEELSQYIRNTGDVSDRPSDLFTDIFDKIYPVGSIYVSLSDIDPSKLFLGKWERIEDRFLLAASSTYLVDTTGGEAEHTLTVEEMPGHSHSGTPKYYRAASVSAGTEENAQTGTQGWTGETGGNQPHNNMPPYLTVYMWKRTE